MFQGLEQVSYKDKLREPGLFSPVKRRVRASLLFVYQYLSGWHEDDATRLFSVMPNDRVRSNGHKQSTDRGSL